MRSAVLMVRESVEEPYGSNDVDHIESLADAIVTLFAHVHAATYRLLVMIAEFDDLHGWEREGHKDCARWLAFRTGIELHAAREKVRAARALAGLPAISASMSRGELSFSKVRALTRVATPETEAELLELSRGATASQTERLVRGWKLGSRIDEDERERLRHDSRTFSVFVDEEGMYVVQGRLTPEVGAALMRAVEAASDALSDEGRNQDAAHLRADAVGLLAERALAAGFAGEDAPVSGTRAERYQVVLHVDPETLTTSGGLGRSELEDGTRVTAETSQRVACDASVVELRQGKDGSVLDVGRKTRTISPALRRALEARDRGCRFPGCELRFTDAHHVKHWGDGGRTSLENCVLLCRHHHRLVHEGGWRVAWWGVGKPVFFGPSGGTFFDGRWEPPANASADELVRQNVELGIAPDGWTPSAEWGAGGRF
jgi:hypothetical protein